jgi:hypothetical protein
MNRNRAVEIPDFRRVITVFLIMAVWIIIEEGLEWSQSVNFKMVNQVCAYFDLAEYAF